MASFTEVEVLELPGPRWVHGEETWGPERWHDAPVSAEPPLREAPPWVLISKSTKSQEQEIAFEVRPSYWTQSNFIHFNTDTSFSDFKALQGLKLQVLPKEIHQAL